MTPPEARGSAVPGVFVAERPKCIEHVREGGVFASGERPLIVADAAVRSRRASSGAPLRFSNLCWSTFLPVDVSQRRFDDPTHRPVLVPPEFPLDAALGAGRGAPAGSLGAAHPPNALT